MKNFREKYNADSLRVEPVKSYAPPKLPTQEEANPELLKKLPSRWQKNAAVVTCMGFVGVLTLSGFANAMDSVSRPPHNVSILVQSQSGNIPADAIENGAGLRITITPPTELEAAIASAGIVLRSHWGGANSGPFYTVHLTEQEAFNIIRAKLEEAGLNFADSPAFIPELPPSRVRPWNLTIDLFDAERNVGVTHIRWRNSHHDVEREIRSAEANVQDLEDMHVGVIYNPGIGLGTSSVILNSSGPEGVQRRIDSARGRINQHQTELLEGRRESETEERWESRQRSRTAAIAQAERDIAQLERILRGDEFPTPEAKAELRETLLARLTAQVQDFIDFLHAEGILE